MQWLKKVDPNSVQEETRGSTNVESSDKVSKKDTNVDGSQLDKNSSNPQPNRGRGKNNRGERDIKSNENQRGRGQRGGRGRGRAL